MNVMEDLKAYLDGELSRERQTEVESAMEQDERLRRELEEIRVLSRLIGDCVVEPEPVGLERTLAVLERRGRQPIWKQLFKEPLRFGWVWAMGLFILLAIFFPRFGTQQETDEFKPVAMNARKEAATAPSVQEINKGLEGVQASPPSRDSFGAGSGRGTGTVGGGGMGGASAPSPGPASAPALQGGQPVTTFGMTADPDAERNVNGSPRMGLGVDGRRLGVTRTERPETPGGPQPAGTPAGRSGDATLKSKGEAAKAAKAAATRGASDLPLLILSADITLQVKDVRSSVSQATDAAKSLGGYVEQSSVSAIENGIPEARMTIRVPEPRFNEAMSLLRKFGKVQAESSSGQDVTAQVADTEARLRVLRASETSYIGMLEKARKVDETLAIRDRLDDVRQQIESLAATAKTLRNQATYSTISLTLNQWVAAPPPPAEPGWFDTAWQGAKDRASGLGRWFAEVGMNLLFLLPIWLPVVVGLWWLGRRSRMRG